MGLSFRPDLERALGTVNETFGFKLKRKTATFAGAYLGAGG